MARRFRGEHTQKVDGKGRVSIPSRFRRIIESGDPDWASGKSPEFVIVYGDENWKFLECYTVGSMENLEEDIDQLPIGDDREYLETIYHGHSMEMSVDKTGRIVLSKKLRDKLEIDDEAFFIAKGSYFEIWKPETYDSTKKVRTDSYLVDKPEGFNPRVLLNRNRTE